jgi:HlyD family secretion protein
MKCSTRLGKGVSGLLRICRPRWFCIRALALGACLLAATAGCHRAPEAKPLAEVAPKVRLERVAKRDLLHKVEQPGYVSAFEQTSLLPKVTGYIIDWDGSIDIGTPIKKGQILATIWVPELDKEYAGKKSLKIRDQKQLVVAERTVSVAERNREVARAETKQALAKIREVQASVERWQIEVKRLDAASQSVNREVYLEACKQLEAEKAALDAAEAFAEAARAREQMREAQVAKAEADRDAAKAQVVVDEDEVQRLHALVDYEKIRAPYDGIVVVRNVNNGDYVEPRYGDESAPLSGKESVTPTRGTPLYVVARTDMVRIFVDVPEVEANYVNDGTRGRVRIPAHEEYEIEGKVVRHSWALDVRSRTRRVEIDLPNPDHQLLPGMYAYGIIDIERKGVWALPRAAVIQKGNQNICYVYEDGKAVETPVQTGLANDTYIEVLRKQVKGKWTGFTGEEIVILGELAQLRDGEKVRVVEPESGDKEKKTP